MAPTAIAPIDATAPKASIAIAPRAASHIATTAASGMRFGRIRIATAAAAPAATALATVPPSAQAIAIVHAAAAGTSLIGATSMNSIAGLVATSHAAARPTAGRSMRQPIAYVASTSAPPHNGTTQNIAHDPNATRAAAISSGSPAGYCGTISWVDGA